MQSFVLVPVPPTSIITLSPDGEPITLELDWRRPSSVSIPDQEGNRLGLVIYGRNGLLVGGIVSNYLVPMSDREGRCIYVVT